ncbi:Bifunctional protein FolD [Quillaja saponaria]|uniref:Bifunctional protein FolD n=1 Tax=Quillaja saponaria TaxID=32244 RepID=A0AAD7LFC3_QUISA|nr:Bifunctional protein FolD [Quillaja saponaria]
MRSGCTASVVLWRRMLKRALFSSPHPSSSYIIGPNYLPDVWVQNNNTGRRSGVHYSTGHNAAKIDGKSIAQEIRLRIASEISRIKSAIGKFPKLAVVLVGDRRDSHTFIHIKLKACEEVGIATSVAELPENCTENELVHVVSRFNEDPTVHGIIVQLPLPPQLDEEHIINFVSPEKDVDGFHPLNMGNLAMKAREPLFIPCASKACIELLLRHGVEIIGKRAVVIGTSKIVGLPTSLLLQKYHATVSTVHAFTKNPEQITCEADIIVSDVGIPNKIRGAWLKQGAVVIDMGTHQVKDPSSQHGFHVTGDVCYEEAIKVAAAITPVPGGVGPVTISMLLSNTLDSAKRAFRLA